MAGRDDAEEPLGTSGNQDIVKGPPASLDAVFVKVGEVEDPLVADLLADTLSEAKIPVLARADRDQLVDTLIDPGPPQWDMMVPLEHARLAAALIEMKLAELNAEDDSVAAEEAELETEPH